MAERGHPTSVGDKQYTFTNVQLLKNETLGTGSYGAVCKAKCDQLVCAAKLIWPALLQLQTPDPGKEHRQPFQRFEQECHFLSRINHPNIVQYLGTYRDPETNVLVLLMELMDESLTHYLESTPGNIPYHIQVNIASDIAQALAFLHSNGIIHRDLSSNNVLLIAGSRAKLTDFGMSKFTDRNGTNLATMTTCPGTPAFMSPEALDEPPIYTEKLDTFSFGVLVVQIVTRQFPKPTDRFEIVHIPSPRDPSIRVRSRVAIPEVERRQAHINLIDPAHPLLPIALRCLKDEEMERPSSQYLCHTLDGVKATAMYEESLHQDLTQLLQGQIQEKDEQLAVKNEQLEAKDEELRELTARNHGLEHEVTEKEVQLRRLNKQLEVNEEITAALQLTIAQRDRDVSELREILSSKTNDNLRETTEKEQEVAQAPQTASGHVNIAWVSQPDIPYHIGDSSSAVLGNKVYFRDHTNLYQFDISGKDWNKRTIPEFVWGSTITCIEGKLTSVGGWYDNWLGHHKCSNKLYSYIGEEWVEHFPPMPTKRDSPAAVYTNPTLIVAGGRSHHYEAVAAVEILNTNSKQWSTVSPLPFLTFTPSMVVFKDYVYLHPGYTRVAHEHEKCSVIKLSIAKSEAIWERVASLPVSNSTLVTFNDHLLAVGGMDSKKKPTKTVYQYDSSTNSWQVVSQVSKARWKCCAVVLPSNEVMVMGGEPNRRSAEVGSLR